MTMLEVFIPHDLVMQPEKLAKAIENGLEMTALAVKVDFEVTTQTWAKKPTFTITREPTSRTVTTSDEIYGYVSEGTRPHIIAAHGKALAFGPGGSPKTAVRVIGSGSGSKGGSTVFARQVHHPGTAARQFEDVISEKWQQEMPAQLQRAIDSIS